MAKQETAVDLSTPGLSGFAPAIASLLALGLPASRLAEIFETNANYIHVLAHRGRKTRFRYTVQSRELLSTATYASLSDDPAVEEAKKALKIRAEQDGVELTPRKRTKLEWLDAVIADIIRDGRASNQFVSAAQVLRALKPYFGYPSETGRLKLAAKLHQYLAWFYAHSGFTTSSILEATHAAKLYGIVYHNTGDRDALRLLGGTCLSASNSYLLGGQPKAALEALKHSQQATEAAGLSLNSEFFRQSGTALFQTRQDAAARAMFEHVWKTTPGSSLKNADLTFKMSSDRHLNLITTPFPNVDDELSLLEQARAVSGSASLEVSVCTHWAAACALLTDSPNAHSLALELIQQNQKNAARFGHQATIAKLLPIALELPVRKRSLWVRLALYQNAYRSR